MQQSDDPLLIWVQLHGTLNQSNRMQLNLKRLKNVLNPMNQSVTSLAFLYTDCDVEVTHRMTH